MFRVLTQFWWAEAYAWAEALDSWFSPPDKSSWYEDAEVVDLDAERRRRVRGNARQR